MDSLWDDSSRVLIGAAVDESGCLVLPTRPCLSVLVFWLAPFVTAAVGLVASAVVMLLARTIQKDATTGVVSQGGRIFVTGVVVAAALLWVSASIAGASMGVSKVIMLGIFAFMIIMSVLLDRLIGWRVIFASIVSREPLARRLVRFFLTSDWSRAFAISVGSPLLILIVLLSVVNQFIRVHLLRAVVLPNERAMVVTEKIHTVLARMRWWNWTSVLRKTIVLCVFHMVWSVGVMKVTIVFFSWLSYQLTQVSLAISTSIFIGARSPHTSPHFPRSRQIAPDPRPSEAFSHSRGPLRPPAGVGMIMFLLPPVPGAPVYMASGVLLTAAAQPRIGYWPACFYAMGVAFCIKLGACSLQQKVIGANLRRSVTVRSACMVNSPLMRAIKLLMSDKRIFTKGKVSTLRIQPPACQTIAVLTRPTFVLSLWRSVRPSLAAPTGPPL